MTPENKKWLNYAGLVFLIAALAHSLFFTCALVWQQPMGTIHLTDAYLWGFLLHMPLWLAAFFICGLLFKRPFPRKIVFLLEALLFGLLLAPIVLSNPREQYDYIVLPFYAVDFFLCLALLIKLRIRLIEPQTG